MSSANVGEMIRKLRLERELPLRELGRKCGLSEAMVSKIETGGRGLTSGSALKLATALKVPVFRFAMTDAEWRKWIKKGGRRNQQRQSRPSIHGIPAGPPNVGEVIRRLRLERGLGQGQLGAMEGVSAAQVYRIETGQQGLRQESALKFARALGVPVFRFYMTDAEWQEWKRKG